MMERKEKRRERASKNLGFYSGRGAGARTCLVSVVSLGSLEISHDFD